MAGGSAKSKSSNPQRHRNVQSQTTSSSAYLQVLGTGMDTHDTMPSILLFFDKFRIIFNAGEGLQRFCTEYKIKLSKVDYVCLTRVCSETVGGLPGLLLTLAGIGKGNAVKLWGPSDLRLLVSAMKSFVPHGAINQEDPRSHLASCHTEGPMFVCENKDVKISAILLEPILSEASTLKPSDVSVVYICELTELRGKFHRDRAMALGVNPGPKYAKLQNNQSVKSDVSDIMVQPTDVMDPSIPGPIVLIVDCPTKAHAEKLFTTHSLTSYYSDRSVEATSENRIVNCIVHLTPASVVHTTNYQNWMRKFCAAEHVMAGHFSKNVRVPILQSSAKISNRLNYLCPELFPASALWSHHDHNDSEMGLDAPVEEPIEGPGEGVLAENLLKFTLLPLAQLGLDKSSVPCDVAHSKVIDDLLLEIPEVAEAAMHISQLWGKAVGTEEIDTEDSKSFTNENPIEELFIPSCLDNIRRDDAEIVLLGTGCSQPSKYRNVSSIFLNLFSRGTLLLDCGEGTLAQLRRRYGLEGAASAIKSLRCIWISHIHADHHAGLVRILALRRDLLQGTPHEQLHVVGPKQLKAFLDRYSEVEDLEMSFVDCKNTTAASWDAFECGTVVTKSQTFSSDCMTTEHVNEPKEDIESTAFVEESHLHSCTKRQKISVGENHVDFLRSLNEVLKEAGLERLTSFPVVHCPEAFGVSLKARERINNAGTSIPGWKVVYSGDTRPCMEVVQASQGATLLIHEATFEDCLAEEAVAKNHSTTGEAIRVGDSAGVYRIVLTHFSQRYPKIPSIDENWQNACIAFDLMSINMADLPLLPHVLPYLKLLFRTDMTDTLEDDLDML